MDKATLDYLTREDNRKHALEKIRRIPLETSPIPPKLQGSKLLAFPFIYGLNLESNATGWSDFMSGLGGSSSAGMTESSTTPSVRLMMTRMAEVFYGLCFQRSMGTPSVLHDDILTNSNDELYLKGAMLNIFLANNSASLNSGLFNPAFAKFWKSHFEDSDGKNINYVDMQAMYGVEACKDRLHQMKKEIAPKKKGKGGGGGGNGNLGMIMSDDEDDEDDENPNNNRDATPHELFRHDKRFQNVNETERTRRLQELLESGDEKITIIICRITRSNSPSVTADATTVVDETSSQNTTMTTTATTTSPPVIAGNIRDPFAFMTEDIGEEEGERGDLLGEGEDMEFQETTDLENLFPPESDEEEETEIDNEAVHMEGIIASNLNLSNISLVEVIEESARVEEQPAVETPQSLPPKKKELDSFLPFKNHKAFASKLAAETRRPSTVRSLYGDEGTVRGDNLATKDSIPKGPYEYYYQPEFTTDPASLESLQSSYPCFSLTKRSQEDEDIGFVVLVLVKDPNWSPRVAMMGLCKNDPNNHQVRHPSGRGRPKRAPQPNPFFCNWAEGTNSSHISRNNFDEKKWNIWAGLYRSKTLSSSVSEASISSSLQDSEEGSQQSQQEDVENDDGTKLNFMDGYATSVFDGLDSIEDPEQVFTLSNAMRWLKVYGGDVTTLQTSVVMHQGDEVTAQQRRRASNTEVKQYECSFKGRQFYRIPYRNWIWGTSELAGLNRSYFPWCEDPLIGFIKHEVLCIKKEHHTTRKQGYTICMQTPETPLQKQQHQSLGTKRIRKTINIKEVLIQSSSGETDLRFMHELRKYRSTNDMASTNCFTLDSLDIPDSRVVGRILNIYNNPLKSPFKTQLTAEKVVESVQACLNKKNDGLSALSQNNSVLMLHERLSNIFDLVVEEKVKEDIAAKLQHGRSNTITHEIFDREGVFSDQFQRYCKLRESFEDMACDHLDATLMSSAAILTQANQALVQYHQRCLKTVNFGFTRGDMASSSFANYLDKMALEIRFLMNIPHATHHFVLVCLGLMDAYRFAYNLHMNFLATGDAATSKSHIAEAVLKALVEKTVTFSDEATPRAYNIESEDLSDRIVYQDEVSSTVMQSGGGGKGDSCDPRATALKKMLTTCQLALTLFVYLETSDGRKIRAKKDLYTNIMGCFMASGNKIGFDDATKTRFYRSMFGKVVIKFTSTLNENSREDYEATMNSFLNQTAAGADIYTLMSQNKDMQNLVEQFEDCAQEVLKEMEEEQAAEREVLSKEGDLKMGLYAPVTNVPQAMCLETFTGSADAPFLQTQTSKALTDRVKMVQVLFNYVFKMIMVYVLPDVNLTLAHMVELKIFAYLKQHGNVGLDNYRVYMRILIMCRIVCIMDALLQVFAVEGSDIAPGGPLFIGLLKAVKPYMFCTLKQAIFAMTLMADEYINPYHSAIIKVFGWNCCNYPNQPKIIEEYLKSWTTLRQALERLDLTVLDDKLVEYLEHLRNQHALSGSNPAMVKILDKILDSIPEDVLVSISEMSATAQNTPPTTVAADSNLLLIARPMTIYSEGEEDADFEFDAELSEEELRNEGNPMTYYDDPVDEEESQDIAIIIEEADEEPLSQQQQHGAGEEQQQQQQPEEGEGELVEEIVSKYPLDRPFPFQNAVTNAVDRLLNGTLATHEIFLISSHQTVYRVRWDEIDLTPSHDSQQQHQYGEDYSADTPQQQDSVPAGNMAFGARGGKLGMFGNGNSNNNGSNSGGQNNGHVIQAPKVKTYDLNYLTIPEPYWLIAGEIRRAMLNVGPSIQDIQQLLNNLTSQTIQAEWSYTRAMTSQEIQSMAGKSNEELEIEGFMVKNKSYPICKERGRVGGTSAKFSLCVHVFSTLCDPKDLIIKAIRSLIFKGMRPGRYELGLMADANRGKFSWVDITDEDIKQSKSKTFNVATGSYMTERERSIVFYNRSWDKRADMTSESALNRLKTHYNKASSTPPVTTPSSSLPNETDIPNPRCRYVEGMEFREDTQVETECNEEELKDSTEWFKVLNAQTEYLSGGHVHGSNILRIEEDPDEWIAKRHFANTGIRFGPHPLDAKKLCWYYTPIQIVSHLKRTCRNDHSYVEYRDFPTAYNQQLRSLYYLARYEPTELKVRMKLGWVEKHWIYRALNHFAWLAPSPADENIVTEEYASLVAELETETNIDREVETEASEVEVEEGGEAEQQQVLSTSPEGSSKKRKRVESFILSEPPLNDVSVQPLNKRLRSEQPLVDGQHVFVESPQITSI